MANAVLVLGGLIAIGAGMIAISVHKIEEGKRGVIFVYVCDWVRSRT